MIKFSGIISLTLLVLLFMDCASHTSRTHLTPGLERERLRKERNYLTRTKIFYGKASFYAADFHGKRTASGEIFDMYALTAAHRSFPFGTICRVTNLNNGKSVIVRINDRGPFVPDRILDLSYGAAQQLDSLTEGVVEVKVEVLQWGENSTK